MIPSLSYLLMGHTTLSTDAGHAAPLLEVCRRRSIPYEDFCNLPEGGISLRFTTRAARELIPLCESDGIPLTFLSHG